MNLIANTGIQLLCTPLEIDLNKNFRMYFHEWIDTADSQLKLEIAHKFSEEEIWVRKFDLAKLGYVMNGNVTESWETVSNDDEFDRASIIPVNTEDERDSGCFQEAIGNINWEKFENIWFPMPFFLLNGKKSEFGPTNWCRFKLIPLEKNGKVRQYNLLLAFDTRSSFEDESFEGEDLNETPVFTNAAERTKDYALCNDEYKLVGYCSEALNCEWVERYILKKFHNTDANSIDDVKLQKPKLRYIAQVREFPISTTKSTLQYAAF